MYVWKTSVPIALKEGTKCTLKGIVKSHEGYNGIKQTVLKNVRI